ncbi:vitamin B12 ABC transporter ATP-binding protein BtuD [Photobacterium swingsii]|uniref:Vitamin B12 import ATP-binding protein BtuD n=1 Tax=Photobacterium swingsii TaxID=680026 RepID=A0A0J8VII9_9GAMM|nr:vitamin B12 ABC transporter ATP-binding protein BtuD [Photobacterium swingsii]KMV32275.1 iron ABC transporter [Photobacterium swingsii]PSW27101.1 vitamin B12 ABC transporter ATP-binding protein BtuD [Photobacterium swingsii]
MNIISASNLAMPPRLLPVSFSLNAGEILHLIGPNGSGKSTAISLLSGLFSADGDIQFLGERIERYDYPSLAQRRCYLSQQDRPAFSVAVYHYLALATSALVSVSKRKLQAAVDEICGALGISDKLNRNIQQLSGGEWQRVRLAAACLQVWPAINPDAKLLLLDEPAAALDIGQEAAMYRLVKKIAQQGVAVIMANHDLNRTLTEADLVILLNNGSCVAKGTPDDVMTAERLTNTFATQVKRIEIEGRSCLLFSD